ncbi:hypothetical protein, partial [Bacillus haynesii]
SWLPYLNGNIDIHDMDCRHKDLCQPEPLGQIGRQVAEKLDD